jgi:hypothetical protein
VLLRQRGLGSGLLPSGLYLFTRLTTTNHTLALAEGRLDDMIVVLPHSLEDGCS